MYVLRRRGPSVESVLPDVWAATRDTVGAGDDRAAPAAAAVAGANVRHVASSDTVPVGGFTPGLILADRYRIIGLLGRGGMGEVYRADDLKLGQPVALKFLPRALADDPVRRERFFAEVRITRQLSHPNICRVYDIAEVNGQHFLSMEYIDGEDLASLLPAHRLPRHREGARHRAAARGRTGRSARARRPASRSETSQRDDRRTRPCAHHRLRPGGRGDRRSAGRRNQRHASSIWRRSSWRGKAPRCAAIIYALGLVLYELYTGKRAFTAPTLAELREQKEAHPPTAPSELRPGIDPVVERVVVRCLERDPRQRPSSAAQVAASLPGGDPLAAALAAGETPSPEMVAAASGVGGGIHPAFAIGLLALVAIGSVAAVLLTDRTSVFNRADPRKPPLALIERIQEHIVRAGYPAQSIDSASGFQYDDGYLDYLRENGTRTGSASNRAALAVRFWYRQSPAPIARSTTTIQREVPPLYLEGEIAVEVDAEGRLRILTAIPPQSKPSGDAPAVDWTPLFQSAGLDIATWKPVPRNGIPSAMPMSRPPGRGHCPRPRNFPSESRRPRIGAAGQLSSAAPVVTGGAHAGRGRWPTSRAVARAPWHHLWRIPPRQEEPSSRPRRSPRCAAPCADCLRRRRDDPGCLPWPADRYPRSRRWGRPPGRDSRVDRVHRARANPSTSSAPHAGVLDPVSGR